MKPFQYQTIKDVKKKIPLLLKKLNLKISKKHYAISQAIQKKARFYLLFCQDEKKSNYLLKIKIQKTKEVLKDLKREIGISKILEEVNQEKKLDFIPPKITKWGKYEGIDWFLRKYQEGKVAGTMKNDFGFKKIFLKKCSPKKIAQAIISYQEISPAKFKKLKLYRHGGWWYGQDFRYYKNTFIKVFLPSRLNQNLLNQSDVKKIEEIFKKSKNSLDKKATTFSHGDLYPNNILLTKAEKIFILDWGLANFSNSSFDPAMVWLQARRDKKWQREFLKFFLKEEGDFKKLFQISLISLTIRLAGYYHWLLTKDKKEYPTLFSKFQSPVFSIFSHHLKTTKLALYQPEEIYEKI